MSSPSPLTLPATSPSTKPESRPNPHPYAIKTTSTALLTRSNSTGTSSKHQYYTPIPPSPTSSPTHALKGFHRHTKSNSSNPSEFRPPPLPIPSSPAQKSPAAKSNGFPGYEVDPGAVSDGGGAAQKFRRSETLPSLSSAGDVEAPSIAKLLSLPENPKLWTPSHLSTFLSSTLRLRGDAALPEPVAKDIAAFIYEQKLSGRVFLRLTETDLDAMGVNSLWRSALLASSRSLRKRILKGRIWGFGSPEDVANDVFQSGADKLTHRCSLSISSRRVPSTVDETDEEDVPTSLLRAYENENGTANGNSSGFAKGTPGKPANGYRNGRVRGMVESLERSGSSHGGSGSEGESHPAPSHSRSNSRSGIVNGSDEKANDDTPVSSEKDGHRGRSTNVELEFQDPLAVPGSSASESGESDIEAEIAALESGDEGSNATSVLDDTAVVAEPYSIPNAPLNGFKTPDHKASLREPSMEELLASSGTPEAWGAQAWETDLDPGSTQKRVPSDETSETGSNTLVPSGPGSARGSRGTKSSKKRSGQSRPALKDLFSITPAEETPSIAESEPASVPEARVEDAPPVPQDPALLAEMQEFRARLEVLERQLEDMQAEREAEREAKARRKLEKEEKRRLKEEAEIARLRDLEAENLRLKQLEIQREGERKAEEARKAVEEVLAKQQEKEKAEAEAVAKAGSMVDKSVEAVEVVEPAEEEEEEEEEEVGPKEGAVPGDWEGDDLIPNPTQLPGYIFLIGIGVCAVIVRSVIKRWGVVGSRR